MRAKKLRTKVVGLVAAVISEIGRKAGISRNYMVKATVKVGGDTYTSGFKSNYAYKDAKRVWLANETSYYDYYPY